MSTSKHINKICITAAAITLILAILFVHGGALGLRSVVKAMGYENRLFDCETVHTVDIVMQNWDTFIEKCENEEYSPCTVVIDGESFKNVGVRAKGNTSLRNVSAMDSQRYSFKLEFDQYENSKSYHGLDKLCLNNLIQDNTMMKDYLVYRMMADFGVDAPLCSFVYITVNGEDWGLYLAVESVEDSFLQRNYGTETGELYKPDSMDFGGGRGNGRDFDFDKLEMPTSTAEETAPQMREELSAPSTETERPMAPPDMPSGGRPDGGRMSGRPEMPNGEQPPFMQMPDGIEGEQPPEMPDMQGMPDMPQADIKSGERPDMPGGMGSDDVKLRYIDDDPDSYANIFDNAKTDVTAKDKARLIASLKTLNSYTDPESVLFSDEVLRYFVIHNFVCNGDSYTGSMIHNYYLYEKDGKLAMIPWDYNLAFGTFQGGSADSAVNASIDDPVSGGDTEDRPMVGWIFSDENYTAQYHDLFRSFLEQWFTDGTLSAWIDKTAALIRPYVEKDPTKFCTAEEFETGVQTLTRFVTLRADAVALQLDGNTTPVDTDGLTLSDMGTMENGGHAQAEPQRKD